MGNKERKRVSVKKIKLFLTLLIAILILSSCGKTSSIFSVKIDNQTFTVDKALSTIFDGINTYKYEITPDGWGYAVTIIYPDGSEYSRKDTGSFIIGGLSDDYDENKYVNGDILCQVLETDYPRAADNKNYFLSMVLFAIGIFNIAATKTAFYFSYGWRYKDAQPSDEALIIMKIGGIAAVIAAVLTIFA